jgi:hypothetical protein
VITVACKFKTGYTAVKRRWFDACGMEEEASNEKFTVVDNSRIGGENA